MTQSNRRAGSQIYKQHRFKTKVLATVAIMLLQQTTSIAQPLDTVLLTYKHEVKPVSYHPRELITPGSLMLAGVLLSSGRAEAPKIEIQEERNEHFNGFRTHADDYLQFSPIVAAYALDAFGLHSKTDIANRSVILLKGEILLVGVSFPIKALTKVPRPDGSGPTSFPSGHTAEVFAAATFLSEEYKDRLPWMPYAAYSMAGFVGGLRVINNKHYISDVLAGAAIGILSMKVAYWTHQYKWGRKKPAVKGAELFE